MINKKNLWFLTLTSIILVLAIYYVTMPLGNDTYVSSNVDDDKEVMVNIEESEALTAARIEKQEQDLTEIKKLQEILLSNDKTVDEKNEAYEQIKYINVSKSNEEKLEKNINKSFEVTSFVQIKDNTIKVVIANKEDSLELANKIISLVNKETNNEFYVTVKFE
jgi:hypothetical protein